MNYKIGDIIKVKIVNIENYGLFIRTKDNISGLIHISQISNKYVTNIRNYGFIGEEINAKIIDINKKTKQMKLTIKNINYRKVKNHDTIPQESPEGFKTLQEKLPIWINNKQKEIKKCKRLIFLNN